VDGAVHPALAAAESEERVHALAIGSRPRADLDQGLDRGKAAPSRTEHVR
jgi:hypothetical protein